tara:strand:+ start:336 stop:602 length:267 start_codon:yes stop_codon:yes gene_type:complete
MKNTNKKLKMIPCVSCGAPMPELRKIKFGYTVCVNCSTVKPKRAVVTTGGTGDHTWNDIQILSAEDAERFERQQELGRKIKFGDNAES